jgi:hypothetical protein
MPPSSNVPRKRLHERNARCEGFARDDRLFDIDAHRVDTKDHDLVLLSRVRPERQPVRGMWIRVTIDREFTIQATENR